MDALAKKQKFVIEIIPRVVKHSHTRYCMPLLSIFKRHACNDTAVDFNSLSLN